MTPQRLREIAALLLVDVKRLDEYVQSLDKIIDIVKKVGHPVEANGKTYSLNGLEKDKADALAVGQRNNIEQKRKAARELQDYNFTLNG